MNDRDLAAIVNAEIVKCKGYESDVLSTQRSEALGLYTGQLPAPPGVDGRSEAVSLDVADSIHATLAQIGGVVRSSQVEFTALSQDDEVQAQTETDFVIAEIEKAAGFDTIDDGTFDALLSGNGWLHAYVDESKTVTEMTLPPDLPDEAIYLVQASARPNEEVSVTAGKTRTTVRTTTTVKRLKIECVAPEDMLFREAGADFDLDEVAFVARRRLFTASQLLAYGISQSKIEELPDYVNDETSALVRQGPGGQDSDYESVQAANALKLVYCCYARIAPGTGLATELRHVWVGENSASTLLNDPADFIPFIAGTAVPMPHRINGTSFAALVGGIQRSKTHALRQFLDNLTVMNASRVGAVEGQVNMSDLTNGRVNGVVRMRSPDAIVPLPSADIGPQAINGLNYLDRVRSQRVGAALDFTEVQAQLMGTSATAAAGQLSKIEMMGGWFASNIVRTMLLPLFILTHRILRIELGGPVMARIGGKWAQTDTSQWQPRLVTDIQMGMTTTEKAERLMALTQVISQQTVAMQSGGAGVITDLPRMYNALSDWIRTSNLGAPDQYLIDPKSPEAQQAQQQKQQADQQGREEQLRTEIALRSHDHDFDLEKQRRDLAYKAWSDELNAEIEEAKITSSSIIDIKKLNINKANAVSEREIADGSD